MAKIELTVGEWVAVVQAADDDAVIALLVEYEAAYQPDPALDPTLDPEVRLHNMLKHLVKHVEQVAIGQRRRAASEAATAAENADAPTWGA